MNKLVLIGGGGHCKSVLDAALRSKRFDEIVITDHTRQKGAQLYGCMVVGSDEELPRLKDNGFEHAFITVGSIQSTAIREQLAECAERLGFHFPVIVDPSATISENASMGDGTFVGKHAVVNAGAQIGKHCIINTGAIVEHDCSVGAFSHVAVGAVLCGEVYLGKSAFIGANSTVIQGLRIGTRAVIGANSTVIRNVNDGETVYGFAGG